MKIKYKTLIEVTAIYEAAELPDQELKKPTEFVYDLSNFICDELATAGGVCVVNEICTKREITYDNGKVSTKVSFN